MGMLGENAAPWLQALWFEAGLQMSLQRMNSNIRDLFFGCFLCVFLVPFSFCKSIKAQLSDRSLPLRW